MIKMFGISYVFNDGLEYVFYGCVIVFWLAAAVCARYYIKKI